MHGWWFGQACGATVQVLALASVIAGCGRLGFEPSEGTPGDGTSGDGTSGDGTSGDGTSGDGPPGAGLDGTCANDLSNVGLGDFSIRFTIQTTATTRQAVLFQRAICAGSSGHWDLYLGQDALAGVPVLEVQSGGSFAQTNATLAVNDGAPHVVEFQRLAGFLIASVDGQSFGGQTVALPLSALPALQVATGHPCASTPSLQGALIGICVRPL